MSGESREPAAPGDDELRAMLEGRAARVGATDAREVLAAARADIAGPASASARVAGDRGGLTFAVRPVRPEREATGRPSSIPRRLAVLGIAAVVAVAVLGSRLGLAPADVETGGSPSPTEEASPGPLPSLPPIAILTAGELAAGIADGSLDGRTVLVDARLLLDPVPCPSQTEGCFQLHLEGPVSIPVTRTAAVTLEAYTRNAGPGLPAAVSIAAGRVTLLGWVVDGVEAPRTAADLGGRGTPLAGGDLAVASGWLLPAPGDPGCIRLALCQAWPRLTDAMPFVDGVPAYDTPGVNVGLDVSLGLDHAKEFMVGRFLVESLGSPESLLPPYRVVAGLDTEVQRVDQQVVRIDPPTLPSPAVAPEGERMTAEDFGRAVRLGELGERIVVVEGRMRLVIGRCRAGGSEDCSWLQLEGLPNVWIDKGDLDVDEAGTAIRRHPDVAPIALRVNGYGVELIGWITAGASTPVEIAALRSGDLPLDPGDVAVVAGWLLGAPASPSCSATPETCAMWPLLSPAEPIPGVFLYGDTGIAVMVAESLGLPPAPATMPGPFVVAAWRAPPIGEPGFEVVEQFIAVTTVDAPLSGSATPAPAVTTTPPPAAPILPHAGVLTADELMTALENASLDGRLLVLDAELRLRTVAWDCPADVPEPCTRFFVDGLPGIALTYGGVIAGSDGADGGAGVSATSGRMIVVPRNGHLELLGRLDGSLDAPVEVGPELVAPVGDVDPLGLRAVSGWLVHTPAPSGCPRDLPGADVLCIGGGDVISNQPPEGERLPGSAVKVQVALREGRPGLAGFGTFAGGPFLLRPSFDVTACPGGAGDCQDPASLEWEVLARYDPATVLHVVVP